MVRRRGAETVTPGHILQLQDSCPPALLGDWLTANGFSFEVQRVWESGTDATRLSGGRPPFLAVLGSSQSVRDARPDWIPKVLETVRSAVLEKVPVLGICFGSQALAVALGGTVSRMPCPEIYWGRISACGPLPSGPWIVWHHDAFAVPPGARRLGWSSCAPLAFSQGPHLGIQFHAEATAVGVECWIQEERDALKRQGVDPAALQSEGRRLEVEAAKAADELFAGWWTSCVKSAPRSAERQVERH